MKTPIPPGTMAGFVAAALACVLAWYPASAQTTYNATLYNNVTNIYGAIWPNTVTHYDAINFATGNGTQLDVDQDVSFNGSALANVFTSTTFTSTGGRVAASMVGTDEFLTPIPGRTFIVQNFALDNVDFTTSNASTGDVGLKIQGLAGGNTSLTLANSTLSSTITPRFYAPSALTFNVSGTSQINGWAHDLSAVGSTTALTVASGGAFTIKDCGDLGAATPQHKLYFSQYTNTATLNGSSLIIDNSAVVFGQNPFGTPANESTMTLSNNATLQLTSSGTPGSSLETDHIVLQSSTLNMGTNTSLKLRNTLELDSSSALLATGAQAEAVSVMAKGNATVSLGYLADLRTGTLDIRSGAAATVAGSGSDIGELTVSSQVLFPTSGTGTLALGNLHAVLNLADSSTMDVTSHAILTNNGQINMQSGSQVTVRQGSAVNNNMEWTIQSNSTLAIDGNATIGQESGQHGHLAMDGTLTFAGSSTPGNNTLNTPNELNLGATSILQMTIDATALTSDEILIDNSAREFTINTSSTLSLNVVNDATLALGTKFLLINYPDWQGGMGAHFSGRLDGSTFALGLNTYQINYNDGDYIPAQGSTFITLTTVPEPATLTLLGLGAIALLGRALRRRA